MRTPRSEIPPNGTKRDISANNASTRYRPCMDTIRGSDLKTDRMECCVRVDVETTTRNSPHDLVFDRTVERTLWNANYRRIASADSLIDRWRFNSIVGEKLFFFIEGLIED